MKKYFPVLLIFFLINAFINATLGQNVRSSGSYLVDNLIIYFVPDPNNSNEKRLLNTSDISRCIEENFRNNINASQLLYQIYGLGVDETFQNRIAEIIAADDFPAAIIIFNDTEPLNESFNARWVSNCQDLSHFIQPCFTTTGNEYFATIHFGLNEISSTSIESTKEKLAYLINEAYRHGSEVTRANTHTFPQPVPVMPSDLIEVNKRVGNQLMLAIQQNTLYVQNKDRVQIESLSENGFCFLRSMDSDTHTLRQEFILGSQELLNLLQAFVNDASNSGWKIISLFRFDHANAHADCSGTSYCLGRAVDIGRYAMFDIELLQPSNANNTIDGITSIINALPNGNYTFGLTRPGRRPFDPIPRPSEDIFFPQQTTDALQHQIARPLSHIVNVWARQKLEDAVAHSAGNIRLFYPDAVDHVHIKALKPGARQ